MFEVAAGATDVTIYVYFVDDDGGTAPGEPTTGLAFGDIETGGSASTMRQGAVRVDFSLVTQTVAGAHTDGGFIEVDATNMPGVYRLDLPDVFGTGADFMIAMCVAASGNNSIMRPVTVQIRDNPSVNVAQWLGTAVTLSGTLPDVNVEAMDANSIASGTIAAAELTNIEDEIWDALKSAHVVADSFGDFLDIEVSSRLAPATAGRTLDIAATGEVALDFGATIGTLDAAQFGADFLTSAKIADDAFLAVNFAANSLDGAGDWNINKTGYSIASGGIGSGAIAAAELTNIENEIWDGLKSAHTTPNSFGDFLDIEVSSRLAPTTASRTLDISATGEVALDFGATIGTLDAAQFGADFLTSAKIADDAFLAVNFAASSLDGKGDWNVGKTEYSLTQSFPTNFSAQSITAGGLVDITQAAADKVFGASGAVIPELSVAAPAATPTPREALMLPFMAMRNQLDVTAAIKRIHNDAGTIVATKALTDDGSTYSEAEMISG